MSRNDSKKPLKIENYAQRTTSVKIPYQIPCAGLCIHKCLVFWECPCVSSHTHNTEMIPPSALLCFPSNPQRAANCILKLSLGGLNYSAWCLWLLVT